MERRVAAFNNIRRSKVQGTRRSFFASRPRNRHSRRLSASFSPERQVALTWSLQNHFAPCAHDEDIHAPPLRLRLQQTPTAKPQVEISPVDNQILIMFDGRETQHSAKSKLFLLCQTNKIKISLILIKWNKVFEYFHPWKYDKMWTEFKSWFLFMYIRCYYFSVTFKLHLGRFGRFPRLERISVPDINGSKN